MSLQKNPFCPSLLTSTTAGGAHPGAQDGLRPAAAGLLLAVDLPGPAPQALVQAQGADLEEGALGDVATTEGATWVEGKGDTSFGLCS